LVISSICPWALKVIYGGSPLKIPLGYTRRLLRYQHVDGDGHTKSPETDDQPNQG
jgi:hypothetical protein